MTKREGEGEEWDGAQRETDPRTCDTVREGSGEWGGGGAPTLDAKERTPKK